MNQSILSLPPTTEATTTATPQDKANQRWRQKTLSATKGCTCGACSGCKIRASNKRSRDKRRQEKKKKKSEIVKAGGFLPGDGIIRTRLTVPIRFRLTREEVFAQRPTEF